MTVQFPERLNIADWLLDARVREGTGRGGDRPAVLTETGTFTYREVQALANRFGHLLRSAGVQPEQRVIIALPDGPEFVAALFGTLKVGAVVVMVNPQLAVDAIEYFYQYTRATVAIVHRHSAPAFQAARSAATRVIVVGETATTRAIEGASPELETFPSHRDDAAIWLFSGGTTVPMVPGFTAPGLLEMKMCHISAVPSPSSSSTSNVRFHLSYSSTGSASPADVASRRDERSCCAASGWTTI